MKDKCVLWDSDLLTGVCLSRPKLALCDYLEGL